MRSKERKTYIAYEDKNTAPVSPNMHPIPRLSTERNELSLSKSKLKLLNSNQQSPAIYSEQLEMLLRENN